MRIAIAAVVAVLELEVEAVAVAVVIVARVVRRLAAGREGSGCWTGARWCGCGRQRLDVVSRGASEGLGRAYPVSPNP